VRRATFGWFFQTYVPSQFRQTNTPDCGVGGVQVVADGADGTYPFNPGVPIIATVRDPLGIGPSHLKVQRHLLQYVLLEANGSGALEEPASTNGANWARQNGVGVMVYYDAGGPPPAYLVNLGDVFALQAYLDPRESPEQGAARVEANLSQFGGRVALVRSLYTRNGQVPVATMERFNRLLNDVLGRTPADVVYDLGFSCARDGGALDHQPLLRIGRELIGG
jgi:hypothetical protein